MLKKLLEDLWSLASSHFLAFEVFDTTPVSHQPLLIGLVVAALAFVTFQRVRDPAKRPPHKKKPARKKPPKKNAPRSSGGGFSIEPKNGSC